MQCLIFFQIKFLTRSKLTIYRFSLSPHLLSQCITRSVKARKASFLISDTEENILKTSTPYLCRKLESNRQEVHIPAVVSSL